MPKIHLQLIDKVHQQRQKNWLETFLICRKDPSLSSKNEYVNIYSQQGKSNKPQIMNDYKLTNNHHLTLVNDDEGIFPHDLKTLFEHVRDQNIILKNVLKTLFPLPTSAQRLNRFIPTKPFIISNFGTNSVQPLGLTLPRQLQLQNGFPYYLQNPYKTISHKSVFSHTFLANSFNFTPNLTNSLIYSEHAALNGSISPTHLEPSNFLKPSVDQKFRYEMTTGFFDQQLLFKGALTYMIRQNQIRDIKKGSQVFYIQRDKEMHQNVELGAVAKVTKSWQILSLLTYAHASIANDSETTVIGNTPRKIPRWKAQLRNQFNVLPITGFAIFVDGVYLGASPGDDLNTFNLDPLTKIGIGFGYKHSWLEDRLSIATEIINLIGASYNQKIRTFERLDRIPDSFELSFNFKF